MFPSPLTIADMDLLYGVGVPEDRIEILAEERGVALDLSASEIQHLKEIGASNRLLGLLANVVSAPAPTVSLRAIPRKVMQGCSARLVWDAAGAAKVFIRPGDLRDLPLKGDRVITLQREKETYEVFASGRGKVAVDRVTIETVHPEQTAGILTWEGSVPQNGEIEFRGLPGVPVDLIFDRNRWEVVDMPDATNDYGQLSLRSKRPGMQHSAKVSWKVSRSCR
jgi:hypothetical protein